MAKIPAFAKPITLTGRVIYGILRRVHPGVREYHRLSQLSGRVGFWEETQRYLFEFLKTMGLKPHHSLLDVGCGPLSAGLPLIDYLEPCRYVGIDVRDATVAEALRQIEKHRLGDRGAEVRVSKTFGRDELGDRKFDFIWASQMLYHLDARNLDALLVQVAARLAPGGVFYGDVLDQSVPSEKNSWLGFSFHKHDPEAIRERAAALGLTMRNLGHIERFGFPVKGGLRLNNMLELRR